jgi:hypothetical protein
MLIFMAGVLFFLYIKCIFFLKYTIFKSQPSKHLLSDSNGDSFLYHFGGSSLHKIKEPKFGDFSFENVSELKCIHLLIRSIQFKFSSNLFIHPCINQIHKGLTFNIKP